MHIALSAFEGPLDLLLHLIAKAKIDVRDIFVSEVTEQYLRAIEGAEELEMDAASEFLAMAATLLEIKSRSLLPRPPKPEPEEAEDPQTVLIRRLLEYRAFKEASGQMQQMERASALSLAKLPEELVFPAPVPNLTGFTLDGLTAALLRLLKRRPEEVVQPQRAIYREAFSVPEQMSKLRRALTASPGGVRFTELFRPEAGRYEVIVTFLAMLELLKVGALRVGQAGAFGELTLYAGG